MSTPDDNLHGTPTPDDAAPLVVSVIAERLRISRRWVESGRATRVRKLVEEKVHDVDVATWRDQVSVERVAIDRAIDEPMAPRQEGDVLVIPVVEERLVVRAERFLREEVRITRRRIAEHERRPVTLRREVAIVERFDPASDTWTELDVPAGTASAVADGHGSPQGEALHEAPARATHPSPTKPRNSIMYTVIGAFDDRQAAQRAVDTLVARGFTRDSIDLQSGSGTMDPTTTGSSIQAADDEGFVAGVRHFFASLFGSEDEREVGVYSEAIRRGSTIVTVDARDEAEADRAGDLLREEGGTIDLDERSRSWGDHGTAHAATGGTAGAMAAQALSDRDRIAPTAAGNEDRMRNQDTLGAEREVVMPVVQEEVKVGKRAVEQGGVRVVRRVTETPVSELVRLREERARIERRPADRAASAADLGNFRESTVEVRERTEEPVVEKVARVVEEVVVGKEVNERTERVEDTARRTDVEIDRLARQADDQLQRESGDAFDTDETMDPLTTPPRTGTRTRIETTRRKT